MWRYLLEIYAWIDETKVGIAMDDCSMDIIEMIKAGLVDEEDLLEYITDNNIEVAVAAAESDLATEPILDIAAHDKDSRVRMAAVKNIHIGEKTLRYMVNDSDEKVAQNAIERLGELL